ncbi:hypothetical protein LCM10_04225 [Rossellomorea aquimaris]|nr:hypothetical protein [Rossellomorea aquimaris]
MNLSPSDQKNNGAMFDLAIAVACMQEYEVRKLNG